MEMTWQEKAKLEGNICNLIEKTNQLKMLKEEIEKSKFQLMGDLEEKSLQFYEFELNEQKISIEIKTKPSSKLNKKTLALDLDVPPKDINTRLLIDSAAQGKLDVDTYNKNFISEIKEELKLKVKKIKPKKSTKKK